jgi:hypothetical protein
LDILPVWEQAFALYENRNFSEAQDLFTSVYDRSLDELNQEDRVAKKYIARCEKNATSPPSDIDWDSGVDNLTEK